MKNILVFIQLFIPLILFAQNSAADKLFDKYAELDSFTSIYISSHMFELFADIAEGEDDQFIETIKGLKGIKILTTEKKDINFFDIVMKELPRGQYQELMVIHEKNQDIKFLIDKKGKKISEFLMVGGGTDNNFMISIFGDIDLKKIKKLSRSMKIDGMENLDKLED